MRTFSANITAWLAGARTGNPPGMRLVARFFYPSGTWGLSDNDDDFTMAGQAYRGLSGAFRGDIGGSQAGGRAPGSTLRLSGTDGALMSQAFSDDWRGKPVEVATAIVDPATGLPAEEVLLFRGRADTLEQEDQARDADNPEAIQISTLTMALAPQSADLARRGGRTRSDADQRLHRDTNDGFYKRVTTAVRKEVVFGRKSPVGGLQGGGGFNSGTFYNKLVVRS